MKISLKELRESYRWLRLIRHVPLLKPSSEVDSLLKETDELLRSQQDALQNRQTRGADSLSPQRGEISPSKKFAR